MLKYLGAFLILLGLAMIHPGVLFVFLGAVLLYWGIQDEEEENEAKSSKHKL